MASALLALELSAEVSSVAVSWQDAAQVQALQRCFGGERGRVVLVEIDQLLREAGLDKSAPTAIVAGTGPGSYTGLRIACAAASTLALALKVPHGGVNSFAATAFAAAVEAPLHLVLDAYRQEAYWACYQRLNDQLHCLQEPRLVAQKDLGEHVPADALVLGDGTMWDHPGPMHAPTVNPDALQLLQWAQANGLGFDGSGCESLGAAEPVYLRAAAFRPQ